jgi:hypothetical protein
MTGEPGPDTVTAARTKGPGTMKPAVVLSKQRERRAQRPILKDRQRLGNRVLGGGALNAEAPLVSGPPRVRSESTANQLRLKCLLTN